MNKHSGFTLVELMITVIIVGILLAVGIPSLRTFLQSSQLITSTNELISAVHLARSEAIKLNTSVSICESTDGVSCAAPATGNWRTGWAVFVDSNTDLAGTGAVCAATGTDCLLRSHAGFNDGRLSMTAVDAGNNAVGSFTFDSRGLPRDAAGTPQSGTISVCSYDGSNNVTESRAVVLNLSGRVRVSDNAAVISCPANP